jgi:hypothetical protein
VRITASAAPRRAGVCHCLDCRKHLGALFKPFVTFARADVTVTGETRSWTGGASGQERVSCARCASPLFSLQADELELFAGCLDAHDMAPPPTYELWRKRRERWLPELGLTSYDEDRP